MEYKTFKKYYLASSIRFIWDYDVIEEYIPVIEKAIQDTIEWFKLAKIDVREEHIGGAIFPSNQNPEKRVAIYIKNRKTKDLGSIYSIFKENFHIITKSYDDRLGIGFPPNNLDMFKRLFQELGKSEKEIEYLWNYTQSLKRRITCFNTLANKSINRQRRVPPKLRLQVLARDGFRCILCGRTSDETTLHVDHITPVAKGSKNDLDYLVTLCQECNLGKGTQSITELINSKKR